MNKRNPSCDNSISILNRERSAKTQSISNLHKSLHFVTLHHLTQCRFILSIASNTSSRPRVQLKTRLRWKREIQPVIIWYLFWTEKKRKKQKRKEKLGKIDKLINMLKQGRQNEGERWPEKQNFKHTFNILSKPWCFILINFSFWLCIKLQNAFYVARNPRNKRDYHRRRDYGVPHSKTRSRKWCWRFILVKTLSSVPHLGNFKTLLFCC